MPWRLILQHIICRFTGKRSPLELELRFSETDDIDRVTKILGVEIVDIPGYGSDYIREIYNATIRYDDSKYILTFNSLEDKVSFILTRIGT